MSHDGCIELFVDVPDELDGQALLDAVMATHGDAFVAVLTGEAATGSPPAPPTS